MNPLLRAFSLILVGMVAAPVALHAQSLTLPLEIRQPSTPWNLQSLRGVPISAVPGVPAGSDGRMTTANDSGSALLPTTNQFRGFVAFGGSSGLASNQWMAVSNSAVLKAGTTAFSAAVATEMKLPVALSNSTVVMVVRRTQVGAPYLTRQVSFPFGSIVDVPTTDENGLPLAGIAPSAYWLPEPYSTNGHTNAPYYWSPHAGKVYAIQAGPISIRWVKAAYTQSAPPDYATNPGNYYVTGGNYFRLFSVSYVVSGTPVKPPRRMYWTEREFRLLGKPIAVPTARVGAANIVYNNNFPRTVGRAYAGPGQTSLTDGTTNQPLQELRTLWFDQQQGNIYAYNQEGRVFVELLGDARANSQTRESLGFEIVDVIRQPTAIDVRTELGDRILPPPPGSFTDLTPEPVVQIGGSSYAYVRDVPGQETRELYATRETVNLNDYLVHWMETGLVGLKWPSLLGRYDLVWPSDPGRFSHYIRPAGVSEQEAQLTAVPLPTANVPVIEYQDALDQPRAKLTSSFQFYTFLDLAHPLHRTLLRFDSGDQVRFERVLSWLDATLKTGSFANNAIAASLDGWNPANGRITFPDPLTAPRVISDVAEVGHRIELPADESHPTNGYLAGHIKVSEGDAYDPQAYADPFVDGFDVAAAGAIIPVNAKPGRDQLEVWWFRPNDADATAGFTTIHWPAVIGHYQLRWPVSAREIVLASNDGSGGLNSLEAKGEVYFQNDATQAGYNPNEEHAFLQGGQVWALRDDLNVTSGTNYSSAPYVLLAYQDDDGRRNMSVFKVLREKGTLTFNYRVEAGTRLQPPMPLPLLDKPLGPKIAGSEPRSLNQETYFRTVASSTTPAGLATAELTTTEPPHFLPWYRELAVQSPDLKTTKWFVATNVDFATRTLRGLVSDSRGTSVTSVTIPPPVTNLVLTASASIPNHTYRTYSLVVRQPIRYGIPAGTSLGAGQKIFVISPELSTIWEWTATAAGPTSLDVEYLYSQTFETVNQELTTGSTEIRQAVASFIKGLPPAQDLQQGSLIFVPGGTVSAGQFAGWRLRTEPVPTSGDPAHGAFTLLDRKNDLWVYRGPHVPGDPAYLTMQFYYRTLPGFYFPSVSLADQPPAGTITPYLRNRRPDGTYVGDPVYGNRFDPVNGDDNALAIQYRPVWPIAPPVLQMAETLTVPKRGLPAVRGQTSLQVLYQQSQVTNTARVSARLHDPTRDKTFELGAPDGITRLGRIPDSVKTEISRGLTYFPLLPPHLAQRFFLDPNRGPNGKLVLRGEFVDDTIGDKYLRLNVLSAKDATTLIELCLPGDPARARWTEAIQNLTTTLERFVESPQKPGTYVPAEGSPVIGPAELAEVTDDDVAVDSYALTATGPGRGYVTLIAGNGLAFTPRSDPVSVLVLRVSDVLYPGELKIVQPSNPIGEQLTLQQVVDLAGKIGDYQFQWKIASPLDGLPPRVYQSTRRLLLGDGSWQHLVAPYFADDGVNEVSTGGIGASYPRTETVQAPGAGVVPFSQIPFTSVRLESVFGGYAFDAPGHLLQGGFSRDPEKGNFVIARAEVATGDSLAVQEFRGRVYSQAFDPSQFSTGLWPLGLRFLDLREAPPESPEVPASTLFREFTLPASTYSQLYLSLDLDPYLGAKVYVNGEEVVAANLGDHETPTTSVPAGFDPLPKVYSVSPDVLAHGRADGTHRIAVKLFSQALAGTAQRFNLRLEGYESVDQTGLAGSQWLDLDPGRYPDGVRTVLGESADVRALADNYLVMRYRATNSTHASFAAGWSRWTTPQLAEGWIKRVLAGINPFNQRITDLFNHRVDTDVSLLTSAGHRWEGDVALNLENLDQHGLIEIYETVLRRGRALSIDSGINYGPANDALLLAAGYLNDLYMIVGNEAWADAANPTIGIGTANRTYGDIATALFAFKGQVPSLLEEELALLRGRDDFLQPGVERSPVYNRLVWNYTRGINAGEVTYAVNYNIQENPDQALDGVIDAEDAARLYPQGHGDAYGHYLTALKGYYSLLVNNNFDWVPRIEAVTVLGQPVSVDYEDERKFASAAAALGRAGRQIFDLTWRRDGQPGHDTGWSHFGPTRVNTQRSIPTTRYWGLDHWASRTALGNYVHWLTGNSILPATDPDPTHEGIQKVDRTTVPELGELAAIGRELQSAVDSADAGLTPLGLPSGSLALDLNPNTMAGTENSTHFEQIYSRAKVALANAVVAFDDAKDVTRLMRSEQDSLADFQASVGHQELAYTSALIELYGTPYPDDIGAGGTYAQGYSGPDLVHFAYTEMPQLDFPGLLSPEMPQTFRIDVQNFTEDYENGPRNRFDFVRPAVRDNTNTYRPNLDYIEFTLDSAGRFQKPATWTGRRASPGKIQDAIARIHLAQAEAVETLAAHEWQKRALDHQIDYFKASLDVSHEEHQFDQYKAGAQALIDSVVFAKKMYDLASANLGDNLKEASKAAMEAIPNSEIFGTSVGGDVFAPARAAIASSYLATKSSLGAGNFLKAFAAGSFQLAKEDVVRLRDVSIIQPMIRDLANKKAVLDLDDSLGNLQGILYTINQRLQKVDDAIRNYHNLLAQGERLQAEREGYRKRTAAVIQGYRTRDAAFRFFRDEKLERYKALFDLAARYAYLTANAYDYETGLLGSDTGRGFVNRIIAARALGIVRNGEPQFAGSDTGDPGLSGALAEMKADWDVVKGRLGFNRPDAYGTTVSLRTENYRILGSTNSDPTWIDVLQQGRRADLLADEDVRRHCLQIGRSQGLPVPGIILEFGTTITPGLNLFGRDLAAGDHSFGASAFATKIFGVGVALEGYRGMDQPAANAGAGGVSPSDPAGWYLDPLGLAATPEVYLLPAGADAMRTPPLGDASTVRAWSVDDIAIPLPFNVGAADLDGDRPFQSANSLAEPLFAVRKHPGFRPVPSATFFSPGLYTSSGTLQRSQYTNNRLVGRSAWNSRWKLVIPGHTLLSDPAEGLERFVRTVRDIKLHFVTYSYSGN